MGIFHTQARKRLDIAQAALIEDQRKAARLDRQTEAAGDAAAMNELTFRANMARMQGFVGILP